VTYDAKDPNTKYPPITMLRPPAGAPNVLIVLIDECRVWRVVGVRRAVQYRRWPSGLGSNMDSSSSRFTPPRLCSPTRQAMLTGRHPSLGRDGRDNRDGDVAPGNSSVSTQREKAPIAGNATAERVFDGAVRKCHEVPVWEVSPAGPFHQCRPDRVSNTSMGFVGGKRISTTPDWFEGTTESSAPSHPEEATR